MISLVNIQNNILVYKLFYGGYCLFCYFKNIKFHTIWFLLFKKTTGIINQVPITIMYIPIYYLVLRF